MVPSQGVISHIYTLLWEKVPGQLLSLSFGIGLEKAETRRHKSKLRGLPPLHLPYLPQPPSPVVFTPQTPCPLPASRVLSGRAEDHMDDDMSPSFVRVRLALPYWFEGLVFWGRR
jgi:hypothetical protein